jgi:hypothetical protein
MPATWVLVAIGALLVVHVALVALAVRRAGRCSLPSTDAGGLPDGESTGGDDRTVQCRECGATNSAEYRYCRACIGELPTAVSPVVGDSRGESRRTI